MTRPPSPTTASLPGTPGTTVRRARADDAGAVSALALRSKAHWGYPPEFLEQCRSELTYTPERCAAGSMWVAERDGEVVGFHLVAGDPPEGELEALFVAPEHIGTGLGGLLLRHALVVAAGLGFQRLVLEADPHAEPFYRRHGAVPEGHATSPSTGRQLPVLSFRLPAQPSSDSPR
ncbi:GNAT family N-acetyltransferase [Nocardioides sp. J54]|uniref:GNAT family N-acetyltransferase n=1 Tax=Nocardioides sp. J54 TaxID=935866 RepID=UPI00068789CE|nr:GNAT family N-acetyltransferase [Nocardioides sp. J54]